MVLLVLATSCKKDRIKEVRPKTAADFEKIMAVDKDFSSFISSSIELENLTLEKYKPSILVQNNFGTNKKVLTPAQNEEFKKIKSFVEMRNFLNNHQIEEANIIVDILEKQSLSFYNFVKKYPEYSKLGQEEKEILIGNSLKANDKLTISTQFSNSRINGKVMLANGDPMQAYGLAIEGCQNSYRTAFRAIWAATDLTMLATSFETAGIGSAVAFAAACVATYYADQERGNCMTLAANLLYNEIF